MIYSGATILGGTTIIGQHSIIGGNTWITRSVPPHSKIYYTQSYNHGNGTQVDEVVVKKR